MQLNDLFTFIYIAQINLIEYQMIVPNPPTSKIARGNNPVNVVGLNIPNNNLLITKTITAVSMILISMMYSLVVLLFDCISNIETYSHSVNLFM